MYSRTVLEKTYDEGGRAVKKQFDNAVFTTAIRLLFDSRSTAARLRYDHSTTIEIHSLIVVVVNFPCSFFIIEWSQSTVIYRPTCVRVQYLY